jgi:hypothetical protein
VDQAPLVGTEWQLASYQDPGSQSPVAVRADSTLSFSPAGRFSAHACNYFGGSAEVRADTITFGQAGSTLIRCTNLTARTILAGDRAGGHFRLAVVGPADRPFLLFEERTAPGEGWGTAGTPRGQDHRPIPERTMLNPMSRQPSDSGGRNPSCTDSQLRYF